MSSNGWKECKFGEIAKLIRNSFNPLNNDSMPYIGLEHIEQETLRLSGFGNSKDTASNKYLFKSGDILFGKLRPYFRKVVKPNFDGVCSTDIFVVNAKENYNQNYLYYLMASYNFVDIASKASEGTKMPRAKWDYLINTKWKVPSLLSEQQAIAEILGSLDDKIELNNKMNQTLEEMAQAIFKSWFVDFDPVKAKTEGKQLTGMNSEILNFFPNSFEESELGLIPKGWEVKNLYDFGNYINGAAYKGKDFCSKEEGLPVIKIAELKNGILEQTKYTNTEKDPKYRLADGDILFSWSGSPDTSINTFIYNYGDAWLNQHIFNVIPYNEKEKPFIYFMLKYFNPVFIEIARNKQTTGLGHITVSDLKRLKFIYSPDCIDIIYNVLSPIFDKLLLLKLENHTLSNIRDTLLPKLISGELKISEAEKQLAGVI